MAAFLVLGTHVIPQVYGHDRELWLVAYDDVEAILQGRLGKSQGVQGRRVDHGRTGRNVVVDRVLVTGVQAFQYYEVAAEFASPISIFVDARVSRAMEDFAIDRGDRGIGRLPVEPANNLQGHSC